MNTPQDITAIRQERNILFDFYGPMLTNKQAACFTMRYVEDCSLTEIAQELGISPQAAVDFIKRAVLNLEQYEKQLGLAEKFSKQQEIAAAVMAKLDELGPRTGSPEAAAVQWIRKAVGEMMFL